MSEQAIRYCHQQPDSARALAWDDYVNTCLRVLQQIYGNMSNHNTLITQAIAAADVLLAARDERFKP